MEFGIWRRRYSRYRQVNWFICYSRIKCILRAVKRQSLWFLWIHGSDVSVNPQENHGKIVSLSCICICVLYSKTYNLISYLQQFPFNYDIAMFSSVVVISFLFLRITAKTTVIPITTTKIASNTSIFFQIREASPVPLIASLNRPTE